MDDETVFLNEIREQPELQANREVYADWLEEHGDPRAEYLRLQMKLGRLERTSNARRAIQRKMRRLAAEIGQDWLVELEQAPIENCHSTGEEEQDINFEFECPQVWSHLSPTEDSDVRMCEQCQSPVFFCQSVPEANSMAQAGACVAIDSTLRRKPGDVKGGIGFMLGRVMVPKRLSEYRRKR